MGSIDSSDANTFCKKLHEITKGEVDYSSTVTGIGPADTTSDAIDLPANPTNANAAASAAYSHDLSADPTNVNAAASAAYSHDQPSNSSSSSSSHSTKAKKDLEMKECQVAKAKKLNDDCNPTSIASSSDSLIHSQLEQHFIG